ncbi:MAG: GNAT family N-acetyltransferase [Cyanobacteriota/Melainabacteria group bacterium]
MKTITYSITTLKKEDDDLIKQAAHLLYTCFQYNWPEAWPSDEAARVEVETCVNSKDRFVRIAVNAQGEVLGWIGAISLYDGKVYEIHPLCVRADSRKAGIGLSLVKDLEVQVYKKGGLTLYLGTDDESEQTSLSGADLYNDTWDKIKSIKNLNDHPFSFWEKVGFKIVGVVPDANGRGKPDIMMAKSVEKLR